MQEIPRRKFLNIMLGGILGTVASAVLYSIVKFILPPEIPQAVLSNVVAGKVGDLQPNSGKIFKFGNKPGILIMTPSGTYKAFSAICTHLDCTVQYRSDFQHIWCACHNGRFDLNGKNIAGPPPSPLEEYNVAIVKNDIIVSKKA
ncbi:MAG TPA: Rieske 2Fe-2S domain-containing protein [Thermodesulfobacteriota bacterium]|nr:Rieske 2Fe-2S domain-containing protein [Thermodesulfobacteriota bacterium]